MKLEFHTFAQVTEDYSYREKGSEQCKTMRPSQPGSHPKAGRRCSRPALPHLQRLSGKRGQVNKGCLCPVTCAVPGAQSGSPQPRLGPKAWITAWPRAGGADRNWDTTRHLRPSPWRMGFGRHVGPRKGKLSLRQAQEPREVPTQVSLEGQPPLASHSLRYAGRDEGHSSSATRRTKNFMGIIHSTPPCVGNVLGPPGRVPQSERGGGWRDDRPSSGAPGAPQRLSQARKRRRCWGSRAAVATPPISAAHRGWGHGAWPRPPTHGC